MSKLTKAELSEYKKLLSLTRKDGSGEHFADLVEFEDRMDKKYGSWSIIPVKKAKGGMVKKGYNRGGVACGASNPAYKPMKKVKK